MAAKNSASAPAYKIATRDIYAVEHPMIVKNIRKGIETFGTDNPFEKVRVNHSCLFQPYYLIICSVELK
jgi:hypothetical protein